MTRVYLRRIQSLPALLLALGISANPSFASEQCDNAPMSKREAKLLAWCERQPDNASWFQERFLRWKTNLCEKIFSNEAPVIHLSDSIATLEQSYFSFDASGTSDSDGDPLEFTWTQLAGTPALEVAGNSGATPQFYAPRGSAGEQLLFEVAVSDGETTVTQQVTVNVAACEDSDGTVFNNCIDPSWYGVTGWEMLNDGSNANFHYENGHNENLIQWQVLDTAEPGYDEVIDIRYADRTGVNGFARIYTASGIGATQDFSEFATGNLNFDMRVLDWGDSAGRFFLKLECIYPCESAWFSLDFSDLNQWQHFSIPAAVLAESGMDFSQLEMGFQVFPDWNVQANAHFQVDNIVWSRGDAPIDNGGDTLTIAPSGLAVNQYSGEGTPTFSSNGDTLYFAPQWLTGEDITTVGHHFDPTVNLNGGEISFELYVPAAATESTGVFTIHMFDYKWANTHTFERNFSELSPDNWNTITLNTFDASLWSEQASDFDAANILYMDIMFIANGSNTSPGEFAIRNTELKLGQGSDGPAPGDGNGGVVISPDSWSSYDVAGTPTIEWQGLADQIVITPHYATVDDNRMYINYLSDPVDLRDGQLTATLEIPAELSGKRVVMQTFLLDGNYRYATPGGTNFANFETATQLDWTLYEFNASTFSYMDEGFDLSTISGFGVQIMFFEEISENTADIRITNLALIPNQNPQDPGNNTGDGAQAIFTFSNTADLDGWYHTSLDADMYHSTSDWENEGALAIFQNWQTPEDQLQVFTYLPALMNLNEGSFGVNYEIPRSYVDDGNLNIRGYVQDVNGNRGYLQTIDLELISINDYAPMSTSYTLRESNLDMDEGFDLSQIALVGFDIYANGKAIDISGEILISELEISEYQEQQMPIEPSTPNGENNPDWEVWIYAGNGTEWFFDNNELVVNPTWGSEQNSIQVVAHAESATDMSSRLASAEIYVPSSYLQTGAIYQLSLSDVNYNYALSEPINLSSLTGDTWNTVSLSDITTDTLMSISDNFDITQVERLTLFISLSSAAEITNETIKIRNLTFNQ